MTAVQAPPASRGGSVTGPRGPEPRSAAGPAGWPCQDSAELAAVPAAPGSARRIACCLLAQWGLGALTDLAALVVSELVTNAVQASSGAATWLCEGEERHGRPPVRVWLSADPDQGLVRVRVWDASEQPPQPAEPGPDETRGRGLLLVTTLCMDYGFESTPGGGKAVWAVFGTLPRRGGGAGTRPCMAR